MEIGSVFARGLKASEAVNRGSVPLFREPAAPLGFRLIVHISGPKSPNQEPATLVRIFDRSLRITYHDAGRLCLKPNLDRGSVREGQSQKSDILLYPLNAPSDDHTRKLLIYTHPPILPGAAAPARCFVFLVSLNPVPRDFLLGGGKIQLT